MIQRFKQRLYLRLIRAVYVDVCTQQIFSGGGSFALLVRHTMS